MERSRLGQPYLSTNGTKPHQSSIVLHEETAVKPQQAQVQFLVTPE